MPVAEAICSTIYLFVCVCVYVRAHSPSQQLENQEESLQRTTLPVSVLSVIDIVAPPITSLEGAWGLNCTIRL